MLYQKLLVGKKPYHIRYSSGTKSFRNHRHPEVELYYCIEGHRTLLLNQTRQELTPGSLAIIGSMNAHETLKSESSVCRALVVEVGPVFLAEHFDTLAEVARDNPVLQLVPGQDDPILSLLQKLQQVCERKEPIAELESKGLLYQLCAAILYHFERAEQGKDVGSDLRAVRKVEQALEMIYEQYQTGITVEQAAQLCGYSKSSFCRVFKRITGDTFHQVLNRHRIEMACTLLKNADIPVEQVAEEVGFSDAKAFCRVFKSIKGVTAGQFRRSA